MKCLRITDGGFVLIVEGVAGRRGACSYKKIKNYHRLFYIPGMVQLKMLSDISSFFIRFFFCFAQSNS